MRDRYKIKGLLLFLVNERYKKKDFIKYQTEAFRLLGSIHKCKRTLKKTDSLVFKEQQLMGWRLGSIHEVNFHHLPIPSSSICVSM